MSILVQPGNYRSRVTVEQPKEAESDRDNYGEIDLNDDANWTVFASRFAQVLDKGSREVFRARQIMADISHIVRMHSDPQTRKINPKMRLLLDGRKLNIRSARDRNEQHVEIELECQEKV